jgi:hydrogenase maturation protease
MKQILIAGIGNIFHGDDAFGGEVVRELQRAGLPAGVQAVDFGIRCYDLAYALAENYDAVIFVDATTQGGKPGMIYLMELDPGKLDNLGSGEAAINGHSLNPIEVLRLARAFDVNVGRLYLVGCEPARLECEDGRLELSAQVAAAVPQAMETIWSLLNDLSEAALQTNKKSGLAEAATVKGVSYAIT